MTEISATTLWDILKHAGRWLANLKRAGTGRKAESVKALRKMISAARETAVYVRKLNDTGKSNYRTEQKLSSLWTDLGFELKDLGLTALAKRCDISGKHWSDPGHYDADFLEKADISLERMERLAREILHEIER